VNSKGTTLKNLLRISSRTFALGIERLPRDLRNALTIAYLLLRVSDFLEDDAKIPSAQKVSLLYAWDQVLAGDLFVGLFADRLPVPKLPLIADTPDGQVAQNVEMLYTAFCALPIDVRAPIQHHVRDSTRGMARWVARGPLVRDEADMDDYMHEVAGRVGYLVTEVFARYSYYIRLNLDSLIPLARECGLALQTVNIIRGLRDDYERGWIYVPESYCNQAGVSREALFDPDHHQQAMQVVDLLVDKAERHLEGAKVYFKSLPPWQHAIRLSCLYPLLFAVRTLSICRQNYRVLQSEAKMVRTEVKQIVRDSTLWGWSNWWVERYIRELSAHS